MKNLPLSISILLLFTTLIIACSVQDKAIAQDQTEIEKVNPDSTTTVFKDPFQDFNIDAQLMQVMRRIFQDSKGNIWFVGDDVYCFNGDSLINYSEEEFFKKNVIRQVKEDQKGNIWFGTYHGIVKYDLQSHPPSFTNYTKKDGLIDNDVWSMEIDSKGNIWAGTYDGVSYFDGENFHRFILPDAEPDPTRGVTSARIVHSIMEDSKGQIWFATNGGAYIYDLNYSVKLLNNLSEKDGLSDNNVNDILEDKNGNIWFATNHKGVCRWDGKTFTYFTEKDGIRGTEAWSLFEDRNGNVWFPVKNDGVYRYDADASLKTGKSSFTNFSKKEGLPLGAVHTILEDQRGRLWMAGFGGMYRYDPAARPDSHGHVFMNITKDGPWTE